MRNTQRYRLRFVSPIIVLSMTVMLFFATAAVTQSQETDNKHGKHHKFSAWLSALSQADQTKIRAAHKQAMKNPDVRTAEDERKKANTHYHELLDREMLKIDPSLKPLLDKMAELRKHNDF